MALLTWITIFPLITVVVVVLGPLVEGLALVPRLAITTAVTVPEHDLARHAAGHPAAARLALTPAAGSEVRVRVRAGEPTGGELRGQGGHRQV